MVSAASIAAAISLPVSFLLTIDHLDSRPWTMVLFTLLAVMVTYLHRSNISRILQGTESRIGKSRA
jgi:glycerol-3-phosphate acyltransferase PlsY